MSTQFCKVGKKTPNLNKIFSIKAIEEKAVQFVEVVSKNKSKKDLHVTS